MKMTYRYITSILLLFIIHQGIAQDENPDKADKLYKKFSAQAADEISNGEFAQAEALFRKALDKKPDGDKAAFNFGNLYFENQKTNESALRYLESAKASEDKTVKHKNFHNLGNLMMEDKQYGKAVEAYKNALRNNPNDEETRYNLALAKKNQEKQKNDGGGGEDKNKDQKKDKQDEKDKGGEGDNKDKQEKDKQDSKEGQDDKESKKKDENAKQDPKDGDQQKQEKPSNPTPQKGKMSEQQIKNLLQAIENKEKNTQEKLNAKKVKGAKVKTEKDW